MLGFLRYIGVLNAGVWFGGALVFSLVAIPAIFSQETKTLLTDQFYPYYSGAIAQLLIARYFKLQLICGIIAIGHLVGENLYFGRAPQKIWFSLLAAMVGFSLIGGFWVQPRMKELHKIKYTSPNPEKRQAAAETFKTWHGISQTVNLFMIVGLAIHLCRVAAQGEEPRFLDAGKLRS